MSKVNPFVAKNLPAAGGAAKNPGHLAFILEVAPGQQEQVAAQLRALPGLSIVSRMSDRFLSITMPAELVPRVEAIPEVVKISADTIAWIRPALLTSLARIDPWLGKIGVSQVEVQVGPFKGYATLPLRWAKASGDKVFTTAQVRTFLGIPDQSEASIKVAVLDTGGISFPHQAYRFRQNVSLRSFVPGEAPVDGMAHGSWVQAAAFGGSFNHPQFGECRGMVQPTDQAHGKVLSNLGFGQTSWILQGMAWAVEGFGARVVSMSLGGPAQGSALDDDPMCRLIASYKDRAIFVVAAGNDGTDWSIGSPGVSPDVVCVGAWGMVREDLAGFSSRGPSSPWYRDNPDSWSRDLERRGQDLLKPDLVTPGGDDTSGEILLSAGMPWYGPLTDPFPGVSRMRGTSMATPIAAGMIALAMANGTVANAADVRHRVAHGEPKNPRTGYGLMTWADLASEA